jgi:hypothetical protein
MSHEAQGEPGSETSIVNRPSTAAEKRGHFARKAK